ncbi:MAG: 16S rRNA (cytosine(1402)-N(4))-methyltransferase RsmH [Dehalococcoidia bacterium]|nr:16S rRNA (cytosine(1402)-N(4))-methyltransferase RsmH [Dehalococcoidia bacterium]
MPTATLHIPVLLKETLDALAILPGGRYIDCTLGAGGHAEAILQRSAPGGQLLGIDADPTAIALAQESLSSFGNSALLVNGNFAELSQICSRHDFKPVNGILFDLGLSSMQLSQNGSGFSFQHDAPLDMRFDPNQTISAADIVNQYSEAELARILFEFGEETHSRQIARLIVRSRPLYSTAQLASLIESVVPKHSRIHPATKTFQALRITVNEELQHLESALGQALELLGHGGKLVVISYHSLEDRIVKNFMRRESARCLCPPGLPQCVCQHRPRLKLLSKQVVVPSLAEEKANPRSRSAKLRVAERIISSQEWPEAARLFRVSPRRESGTARKSSKKRMCFNTVLNLN